MLIPPQAEKTTYTTRFPICVTHGFSHVFIDTQSFFFCHAALCPFSASFLALHACLNGASTTSPSIIRFDTLLAKTDNRVGSRASESREIPINQGRSQVPYYIFRSSVNFYILKDCHFFMLADVAAGNSRRLVSPTLSVSVRKIEGTRAKKKKNKRKTLPFSM